MIDDANGNSAPNGAVTGAGADGAGGKANPSAGAADKGAPGGGGDKAGNLPPAGTPAADAGKGADKGGGKSDGLPADLARLLERVPEPLRGKDIGETLDRVLDGQKGWRDHIAKNGLAPEKIEDYGFKPSEKLAADFFTGGEMDAKLTNAVLGVLKNEGIGKLQGSRVVNGILEAVVQEMGLQPSLSTEAERAKLVPPDALGLAEADKQAAVKARIDEATEFTRTLERHGMPAAAVNELAAVLDSAGGVLLAEFIKANLRGDGLALNGQGSGNAAELAKLEEFTQSPRYNDDMKFRTEVQNRILQLKGLS